MSTHGGVINYKPPHGMWKQSFEDPSFTKDLLEVYFFNQYSQGVTLFVDQSKGRADTINASFSRSVGSSGPACIATGADGNACSWSTFNSGATTTGAPPNTENGDRGRQRVYGWNDANHSHLYTLDSPVSGGSPAADWDADMHPEGTVAAWVNLFGATSEREKVIATKWDKTNGQRVWRLAIEQNSKIVLYGDNNTKVIGATTIPFNEWIFVVGCWDRSPAGGGNTMEVYLNGQSDGTSTDALTNNSADDPLSLGAATTGVPAGSIKVDSMWNGRIDWIALWQQKFSAKMVECLYTHGLRPWRKKFSPAIFGHTVAGPGPAAILPQLQYQNLNADLFDGTLIS